MESLTGSPDLRSEQLPHKQLVDGLTPGFLEFGQYADNGSSRYIGFVPVWGLPGNL